MTENDSARFKIRLDDDEPEQVEAVETAEKADVRFGKINRRLAFLAVLVPVLTGLIVFYGYYDMKQKLTAIQNTGQTDVEKISSQLSTTIATVSQQVEQLKEETAKLNERLGKETDALTRQISSLSKKLEKESNDMRTIAAEAVDKKALGAASAELNKKIESIHNSFQAGAGEVKTLDEKLSRELAVFTQRIRVLDSEIERLRKESADLSKNRLDQNNLKAALEKQQAQYREELQKLSQSLENKMRATDKRTEPALTPTLKSPASNLNKMPPPVTSSPVPPPKVQAPVQKPAVNRSGDIVEQTIE